MTSTDGVSGKHAEAEEKSRAFTLMMKDVFPKRLNSDKSKLRVKDTSLKDVRVVFDELANFVRHGCDVCSRRLRYDFGSVSGLREYSLRMHGILNVVELPRGEKAFYTLELCGRCP